MRTATRLIIAAAALAAAPAAESSLIERMIGRSIGAEAVERLREVEDPWPWAIGASLRLSYPQLASLALSAIIDDDVDGHGATDGWAPRIEAEVGIGGGAVSIGLCRIRGGFGFPHWLLGALWAPRIEATALRTWGPSLGVEAGQTFVGPRVGLQWAGFYTFTAGALVRVAGDEPDHGWTVVASIGIGL